MRFNSHAFGLFSFGDYMPDPAKPATSEEDGKNPEGKPEDKGTPPKSEDAPKFTQADQDALAAKVRAEEKAKATRAAEEAERKRTEEEAKKQGEFQKLAETHEARIKELEPQLESVTAERDRYKLQVAELAEAELKALPDEVRDISPAQYAEDKSLANPLDVIAWLPKGKALAEKLNSAEAKPGMKKDPKEAGNPGNAEADKRARLQARRAYMT